ncbi:hypothetical protein MMC08_006488 [Hypocenomyce scalaris]|nr:hypothetical protein [Hypocenomyce scalaris]
MEGCPIDNQPRPVPHCDLTTERLNSITPYDRILQPHPGTRLLKTKVPAGQSFSSYIDRKNVAIVEETSLSGSDFLSSKSSASVPTLNTSIDYMTNPFTCRYGRRFLRDPTVPYPLPVDLVELHRQSLRTLLLLRVYGAPFCSPSFEDAPPKKVLEIACGSGLWSSECHEHFKRQGFSNISFTGLDIAPLAPDLKQQGIDWRFVQHDLRKLPLPFADEEFDFIFVKDTSFCTAAAELQVAPLDEPLRILQPGGVLEVWDSDHIFRNLLPHSSEAPGLSKDDLEQAQGAATYPISSSTAFATAQNKYLQDYNDWAQKALDKRRLSAVPCASTAFAFSSSPDVLLDLGSRRVAIPLGGIRWEREGIGSVTQKQDNHERRQSKTKGLRADRKILTQDQAALRRTALLTVVQFIESLEPMLKEASGKRQDEWDRWWSGMTTNLLEQNGTLNGECLEVGAWWGRKRAEVLE